MDIGRASECLLTSKKVASAFLPLLWSQFVENGHWQLYIFVGRHCSQQVECLEHKAY